MMKHLYCIFIMLTVMPITAAFGLISFDPENWGGQLTITNVLMVALFGLLSVPLWITFLPALLATPSIMKEIASNTLFHTIPILKFISISFFLGALVGILILSPTIFMSRESIKLMANWVWAGAFSGAITYTTIALLYRVK